MPWKLTLENIPAHNRPLQMDIAANLLRKDAYRVSMDRDTMTVEGPYANEMGELVDKLCVYPAFSRLVLEYVPGEQE